jgi:hypothetical protein
MKLTKTFSNRDLKGEYVETAIDAKKKTSNRLTSICGKYYTIITSTGEMLEIVGKRSFNSWASKNEYVTDF